HGTRAGAWRAAERAPRAARARRAAAVPGLALRPRALRERARARARRPALPLRGPARPGAAWDARGHDPGPRPADGSRRAGARFRAPVRSALAAAAVSH